MATLYVKIEQNTLVSNTKVFLQDIATLYSEDARMVHELNKVLFFQIKEKIDKKYVCSIMRVVELVEKRFPGTEIINMGEKDFIISYKHPQKTNRFLSSFKVVVVCLIIGIGAAFSIMTFNEDVSVGKILSKSYNWIVGEDAKQNGIVELAYSIGLPIGICVFFNHYTKRGLREDPTPVQVEMRIYEEDVNKALIKNASREGKTIDAN